MQILAQERRSNRQHLATLTAGVWGDGSLHHVGRVAIVAGGMRLSTFGGAVRA